MIQPADVVRSAYNLLLGRDPEPTGLRHWSHALESGLSRVEFVRAILASAEFRDTMTAVEDLTKFQDVDLVIPVCGRALRAPASDVSLVPHLLKHRCWEPHVTRYLRQELRRRHIFMDVGANLGYFTVLCAPLVERVVAFEPVARTHDYCRANIDLNGLTNVDLRRCALWSEDTTLQIRTDPSSVMTAAVVPEGQTPPSESIEAVSLDSLIADGRLALDRLDVLKMDAEGAEMSALRGMRGTIERFRPQIIMEVNRPMLAAQGAAVEDVWAFFDDRSYGIGALEHWKEQDPIPVESVADLKRLCPSDALIDIVAVSNDVAPGRRTSGS